MSKKKINPDHVRRRNRPTASDGEIEQQFKELLSPAVFNQETYYRSLGLRSRILTLPLLAVITVSGWAGLAAEAVVVALVVAAPLLFATPLPTDQALVVVVAGAFSGLLGWVVRRELLTVAEWRQRPGADH